MTGRRWLIVVVSLGALLGLVLGVTASAGHHRSAPPPTSATTTVVPSLVAQGLSKQTLPTLPVSQSPVQVAADQQIAQLTGESPGLAEVEGMQVPAPAISGGWPRLPVANSPEMWATEFVAGLLNVDYAHQSRPALGPWLMAQEAPEILPGVPASAADKILYTGLFDPRLVQATGPPIPSAAQWVSDAKAGVRQSVSDLLTQPDPNWQQLISSGWQPLDVRMDGVDVFGLLTITRGSKTTVEHFTVAVGTGSARWHSGYGTIELQDWSVTR